jgi:AcrR family transcriptional regulator
MPSINPQTKFYNRCMEQLSEKEEVHYKICNAVLGLEVKKGHLSWTISDIAKESSITRSLIYHYFGKDKEIILEEAYRFMLQIIFNTNGENRLGILDRMKETLDCFKKMPYLPVLFYLEKDKDSKIGNLIRETEANLLKSLQKDHPKLSKEEILKIYLLEIGAVFYKTLTVDKLPFYFGGQNWENK